MIKRYLKSRVRQLVKLKHWIQYTPILRLELGFIFGVMMVSAFRLNMILIVLVGVSTLILFRSRSLLMIFGCIVGVAVAVDTIRPAPSLVGTEMVARVLEVSSRSSYLQRVIASYEFGKALVEVPIFPKLETGDLFLVKVLSQVDGLKYSDDQYHSYLYTVGINIIVGSRKDTVIETPTNPIDRTIQAIRSIINTNLVRNLSPKNAALGVGIITGQELDVFDRSYQDSLSRSGLSHIVAVSGFNFSIIYLAFQRLKHYLPKVFLTILTAAAMLGMYLLVGTENLPATRAVVLALLVLLTGHLGKSVSIYIHLITAISIILFLSPTSWLTISFQLSLMAFLGVIILTPRVARFLSFIRGEFREIASATIAATVSTSPVIIPVFGGVSLISILSNLIVLPLVPVAMVATVMVILLGNISLVGDFLSWSLELLLGMITGLIELFGSYDFAYSEEPWVVVIYIIGLLLVSLIGDYLLFKDTFRA